MDMLSSILKTMIEESSFSNVVNALQTACLDIRDEVSVEHASQGDIDRVAVEMWQTRANSLKKIVEDAQLALDREME